jgi:hypothetical protein
MNGKKITVSAVLLALISLLTLLAACSQNGAMAGSETQDNTQALDDISDKLTDLENRLSRLEQGFDERVVEYNIVQSAFWEMIVDNKLDNIPGNNFPYTNDMREFPSIEAPLYGYDKNGDGIPDTNYVPFEKTVWFYQADDYIPDLLIQGPDPSLFYKPIPTPRQEEVFETELHNIQTAVMAMLADSYSGLLDDSWAGISDMDFVTTDSGQLILSNYLTGLNADGTVKSGCTYNFAKDGTVTQNRP